jgi:hypothetical protein
VKHVDRSLVFIPRHVDLGLHRQHRHATQAPLFLELLRLTTNRLPRAAAGLQPSSLRESALSPSARSAWAVAGVDRPARAAAPQQPAPCGLRTDAAGRATSAFRRRADSSSSDMTELPRTRAARALIDISLGRAPCVRLRCSASARRAVRARPTPRS